MIFQERTLKVLKCHKITVNHYFLKFALYPISRVSVDTLENCFSPRKTFHLQSMSSQKHAFFSKSCIFLNLDHFCSKRNDQTFKLMCMQKTCMWWLSGQNKATLTYLFFYNILYFVFSFIFLLEAILVLTQTILALTTQCTLSARMV